MTRVLEYYMQTSYDAYLGKMMHPTYPPSGPMPPAFADIPRERIIDMDEVLANAFEYADASIVEDAKASNGLSMRVPKAKNPSWAVQAKTERLDALAGFGRYRVYAVVRCDLQTDTGVAFSGGVWDGRGLRDMGPVSFPIAKPKAPTADENDAGPDTRSSTIPNGAPVTDGEYHIYDFGAHDFLHPEISVWVGTTTGDIYVDRFLFVREP